MINPQDAAKVMDLATAYWGSQVILTANRLNLFEIIARGNHSVDQIADASNTRPRPLRLMLKACISLGLLEETPEGFKNTAVSTALLVPGNPAFLGNTIRYSDDLYDTWGKLEQALIEDKPQLPAEEYLGRDLERTRHFVYGMHNRALGIGNAMANIVDLSDRKKMLDVGGGPGTYSCLFARKFNGLTCTVMDLPDIVKISREIIEQMGVSDQVSVLPGDYYKTGFPNGNDAVLISGVFHRETDDMCRQLIQRANASLEPDGKLIISDVFTNADGNGPTMATLFGLNMMLTAPNGGVHADADVRSWMQDAGFQNCSIHPFPEPMPHRIVMGTKE